MSKNDQTPRERLAHFMPVLAEEANSHYKQLADAQPAAARLSLYEAYQLQLLLKKYSELKNKAFYLHDLLKKATQGDEPQDFAPVTEKEAGK